MKIFAKGFAVDVAVRLAGTTAWTGTIEDETVAWLKAFIKVDTINPPGNEGRAVEFYGRIFEAEGIAYESAESAPGRGNIWARLEGGDKPAFLLLQHTDVVPADPDYWTTDPLSAEERDGYLYGRGALDMKSQGILQLAAFVALRRSGRALNRDVIFMATADEEAGGLFGAGWLAKNRPELFEGVGLLVNEGGRGKDTEKQRVFSVEVTQKVPVWLRLTATDTPGHGSMPQTTSAVTQLVQGLERIRTTPFPARIVPAVDDYFKALSQTMEGDDRETYADMAAAVRQPGFLAELQKHSPYHHALTRDACSITRLGASPKINVVPPSAWAEIDCRILPDRPAEVFIAAIRDLMSGLDIEVSVIMAFTPAVSSTDSELYRAIERVIGERHPGALVIPGVASGFTDSHFFRDMGIESLGFSPLVVPESEYPRVHGNDERVNLSDFRRAVGDTRAIIEAVVYD